MKVHTIRIDVGQEGVERRLERKVNKRGQTYDTYNHGFYPSKTDQKQVQQ